MKVKALIKKLEKFDPKMEVEIMVCAEDEKQVRGEYTRMSYLFTTDVEVAEHISHDKDKKVLIHGDLEGMYQV